MQTDYPRYHAQAGGDTPDAAGAGKFIRGKASNWTEQYFCCFSYIEVRGTKGWSGWGWLVYQPLALPLQGWQSCGGERSGDRRKAGTGEHQQSKSLVPGDDASSKVTADANSPSGKPQWSRHAVLGAQHSCALLEF